MTKALKVFLFISLTLFSLNISPQTNRAQENTKQEQQASQSVTREGLIGHFFEDNQFSKPILVAPSSEKNLAFDYATVRNLVPKQQTFSSYRWMGYIVSSKAAKIELKLEGIHNYHLEINNKSLSKNKKYSFIKDKPVKIKIEGQSSHPQSLSELEKIKLIGIDSENKKTTFQKEQFRNPEFRKKEWKKSLKLIPLRSSFSRQDESEDDVLKDTDGDQIYDKWEESGYTIRDKVAVPWKEEYGKLGYTKFLSNPLEAHTAGDPYTDYEKAARDIPQSNGKETMNPLVAAFPSVNVSLEKVILSRNENLSNGVGSSSSSNWSYTNTEEAGGSFGWSEKMGLSFGVSSNYQHSETVAHQWGSTQENSSHLNSAESAYLNANVRYRNVGSGAIYDVKPTTNFVLNEATIGTIKAKENTTALTLSPQGSYPKNGQHGIAINTMDDFSSRPIPLNKEQLEAYMTNEAPILLETTQTEGKFAIKNVNGQVRIGEEWNGIREEVKRKTASIILDTGETVKESWIAAKDYSYPEDKTPSVTLKEALKLAYPKEIKEGPNGLMYYKGTLVNEESVLAYTDPETAEKIKEQIEDTTGVFKDVKTLYDVKLEPEMNFTIKTGVYNDGAESSPHALDEGSWSNSSKTLGGKTGLREYYSSDLVSLTELKKATQEKLKKGSECYLSLYLKSPAKGNATIVVMGRTGELARVTANITDKYQRTVVPFYNDPTNPPSYILVIGGVEGIAKEIYWDNVAIINGNHQALETATIDPPVLTSRPQPAPIENRIREAFSNPKRIVSLSSRGGKTNTLVFLNVRERLGRDEPVSFRVKVMDKSGNNILFNGLRSAGNYEGDRGDLSIDLLNYHYDYFGYDRGRRLKFVVSAKMQNGREIDVYSSITG